MGGGGGAKRLPPDVRRGGRSSVRGGRLSVRGGAAAAGFSSTGGAGGSGLIAFGCAAAGSAAAAGAFSVGAFLATPGFFLAGFFGFEPASARAAATSSTMSRWIGTPASKSTRATSFGSRPRSRAISTIRRFAISRGS